MKPHLSLDSQINLLLDRKLEIADPGTFKVFIKNHNYYRLRGYFHPFLTEDTIDVQASVFKPGSTSQVIEELVDFDRTLRNLLFEALAVFETRFRASLAYHAGAMNPYIHLDGPGTTADFKKSQTGDGPSAHETWLNGYWSTLDKHRKNDIVRWHLERYQGRIPIWAAVELLDFGKISKLYRGMEEDLATKIADDFGGGAVFVKGLAATLNDLRNHVAHQSRLWNFHYPVAPVARRNKLPELLLHLADLTDYERHKLFTRLSLMLFLDTNNDFGINFSARLLEQLHKLPHSEYLSQRSMGFAEPFKNSVLWSRYFSRNGI